jgi:glutamine amidotransferase
MKLNVVIIDYGVGNIRSVTNALEFLCYRVQVGNQENKIKQADALILPGVGAFETAIRKLKSYHLDDILSEQVIIHKKPILGICLGMQLMATSSEENGIFDGLNWIEGKVVKLNLPKGYKVPHVGWNAVKPQENSSLYKNLGNEPNFYFDHSYHYETSNQFITGVCNHGEVITASIQKENIFGVQFHPEKSQINGLKLLRNFFRAIQQ